MNPEIKAEWLAALRDPEAKQTTGILNLVEPSPVGPIGMCCLGVLCEVAVKHGVVERSRGTYGAMKYRGDGDERAEDGVLPESVVTWAGLGSNNPRVDGGHTNLSNLNDDEGLSFAEIADIIEEQL
jgi:hypothetical protein